MAKARQVQQQIYPGMFGSSKGARQADDVSTQDLASAAQQLQMYQRVVQLQRAQQLLQAQQGQQQVIVRAKPQNQPAIMRKVVFPKTKQPETITLDEDDDDEIEEVNDDDDEDDDGGEIVLDGAPEMEVTYEINYVRKIGFWCPFLIL